MSDQEPCLCVDLDGTLIAGDTLAISVRAVARRKPWVLIAMPAALLRGRAGVKAFLSSQVLPDPAAFPWREGVLSFLRDERRRGRRLLLVTAAHRRIADAVASHLSLFDGVLATEGTHNVKSGAKLAAIRKLLGDNEFDYIGDSMADLPVFAAARRAYLVAPSRRLLDRARGVARLERVFGAD